MSARQISIQYDQCRQWAQWLIEAGYEISFQYTSEPAPFDREWQVWTAGNDTQQIATIDIDGTGASWHGPDDLWLTIIGPHVGVTA